MLRANGLTIDRGGRRLLGPVSIAIGTGEVTVIAGPNGAGKSTLLKALAGDMRPSEGTVALDGRTIKEIGAAALAQRRAVLPQASHLAFPFTVLEVVRLAFSARGGRRSEIDARAMAALAEVDMRDFAGRYYQQLSGGEQQRVQLARVLCQIEPPGPDDPPRYLLLDEPTSNLDVAHQLQIQRIARNRAEAGFGVVAILHDLNLASLSADRLVLMADGTVLADGPPELVLTEETVERVYGLAMRVMRAEGSGLPVVLPLAMFAP